MKNNLRTDLVDELIYVNEHDNYDDIVVTCIDVDKDKSKVIEKKEGRYVTVEFNDIDDYDRREKVKKVFSKELVKMMEKLNINDDFSCLIIGLGNEKSTPDALGPFSLKNIIVTNHLFEIGEVEHGFRRTFALSPGVMGETGIETSEIIKSLVYFIKPDFLIVIDALATSSVERLNKTIQISDAGINPGSGIGNKRKEISKEIIGIPVIAIGIPTVVDAVSIVSDTINYICKNITHMKNNINNPSLKLKITTDYKREKIDKEDRQNLFGIVGTLEDEDVKKLIFEVLTPIGYNLMVTPKEEDFVIELLSEIISSGINKALHKSV